MKHLWCYFTASKNTKASTTCSYILHVEKKIEPPQKRNKKHQKTNIDACICICVGREGYIYMCAVVGHSRGIPGHCWRSGAVYSWANSSRFAAKAGGDRRAAAAAALTTWGIFLMAERAILLLFLSFTSSLASFHPREKKNQNTHKKRRKVRASEKRGKTLNERRLRARRIRTHGPRFLLLSGPFFFFFFPFPLRPCYSLTNTISSQCMLSSTLVWAISRPEHSHNVYRWKRTHISVRFLILFFWAVRSFFFLSLSLIHIHFFWLWLLFLSSAAFIYT